MIASRWMAKLDPFRSGPDELAEALRYAKHSLRSCRPEAVEGYHDDEDAPLNSTASSVWSPKSRRCQTARRADESPRRVVRPNFRAIWRPGGINHGAGLKKRPPVLFDDTYVDPWRRQRQDRAHWSAPPERDRLQGEESDDNLGQERWVAVCKGSCADAADAEVTDQVARVREKGRERLRALKHRYDAGVQRFRREKERRPPISNFSLFLREKQKEEEEAAKRAIEMSRVVQRVSQPHDFLKAGLGFLGGSQRRAAADPEPTLDTAPPAKVQTNESAEA